MMSLQSMAKLLGLKEYVDYEFKEIETSLHAVTSLVNYNYRYFTAKRCDQISEEDLRSNDSFKLQDLIKKIKQMG
jgi:hypothetical protein